MRARPNRRRVVAGLWVVAVALAVLVAVGAARGERGESAHRTVRCTHGASSIGPVEIVNRTVVRGSVTPRTQACLP